MQLIISPGGAGPWFIYLGVNDGRFPDFSRCMPKTEDAKARCLLSAADAAFLAETLPRLPCHDNATRPVTLDLNLGAGDVGARLIEGWSKLIDDEGMKFDSVADEQAIQKQIVDLVAAYLKAVPVDEPRPLAVEAALEAPLVDPFTGEDLGIPLVGIVDLILDGTDGPLVADFKTSARSAEPLEIVHEIQLSSYAFLFRHVEQRQEAGLEIRSLIKTKAPKVEFYAYPARTEAHFKRLFAVIREYLEALDSGRFNYRPGFGCSMCDFRDHCSRWAG